MSKKNFAYFFYLSTNHSFIIRFSHYTIRLSQCIQTLGSVSFFCHFSRWCVTLDWNTLVILGLPSPISLTFPFALISWILFLFFFLWFYAYFIHLLHLFFRGIFLKYLFILAAVGLSCSMQDLVPPPGIEPGTPALGMQSLSHWTTRDVLHWLHF